jgi:glycopeptide antibiotics resistance protein
MQFFKNFIQFSAMAMAMTILVIFSYGWRSLAIIVNDIDDNAIDID